MGNQLTTQHVPIMVFIVRLTHVQLPLPAWLNPPPPTTTDNRTQNTYKVHCSSTQSIHMGCPPPFNRTTVWTHQPNVNRTCVSS